MHNLHGSPFYNGTFPKPNTRALPESSTSSIARKGVQRVEDPLAGSRGSAPWVPPINTRKLYEKVTNSIARKGQGRNSLAGCRGSAPAGVKGQSPLRSPEAEPLAFPIRISSPCSAVFREASFRIGRISATFRESLNPIGTRQTVPPGRSGCPSRYPG